MRILLCSRWFHPSVGGTETVSKILAEEWTAAGCEVAVVTDTAGDASATSYDVIRRPGFSELRKRGAWADIVVQNIVSLRTLLPLTLSRKPLVVIHGSWLRRTDGKVGWQNHLKQLAVRHVHNVAISGSIAASIESPSTRIQNPFEAREFTSAREAARDKDLVFMGRLVSDKGVDLLLRALGRLREENVRPTVTIIGDGPDMAMLQQLTKDLGLMNQVTFLGFLREGRGEALAIHKVMVIPSRWAEPFGVVALEGIASGCALVASAGGGMMEAAGECALFFPNGDVEALASALKRVLGDATLYRKLVAAGPKHLETFQPSKVARRYLDLFEVLTAGSARNLEGAVR